MRISVRILISSLLAAVVIFGCSFLVFASEETQEPIPEGVLIVDQDQSSLLKLSSDIKSASSTDYSTSDIYNLLNSALKGSSSSTTYSLPYIANRVQVSTNYLNSLNSKTDTTNNYLSGLCLGLYGSTANTPAFTVLDSLYHYNDLDGNSYGVAQLLAMSWGHLDDISDNLTSYLPIFQSGLSGIDSSVDAVNSSVVSGFSTLHSDLSSLSSDFNNVSWTSSGLWNILGYSSSLSNAVSGVYSSSGSYCVFQISSNVPMLSLVRLQYFPRLIGSGISLYNSSGVLVQDNVYYDSFQFRSYVYLNPYENFSVGSVSLKYILYCPSGFIPNDSSGSVQYVPDGSLDFYIASLYISNQRLASSTSQLERLVNILAPDNVVSAEEASQGVIDQALDDFTGSGSGAAKISDSAAMSSVSGSVQSGLDTGASVSNATSVFSLSSDFWGWFSQSNSNYINNPYPAPTYTPTRAPGDQIVDFLSTNSELVQDLLGGDQK